MKPAPDESDREVVEWIAREGMRIVLFADEGDSKGPTEVGWPTKVYSPADFRSGEHRVGILTGTEINGQILHDLDNDWAPGVVITEKLIPPSACMFGRASKWHSHSLYLLPEGLTTFKYEDVDGTCLLEIRGVKSDGTIGFQTMAAPSWWSKDGKREQLTFRRRGTPTSHPSAQRFKRLVDLAAIGMLVAKHLGHNGFGHEARLAWAGLLLRYGVDAEDLILMGEGMSVHCNNREVADVRQVIESTVASLKIPGKKVKGGPALAKLIGDHGKQVVARINEWLGRDSDFLRTNDGVIVAKNQENIRRAVDQLGHELSFDEFSCKKLIDRQHLEDQQWESLYLEIDREFRFQPPIDYFRVVINDIANGNPRHPVKQYLDTLRWDGHARLDTWLIRCAGVKDTPYTRAISSIVLIAAVRRIRKPGCKYDEMIVWECPMQGTDKSSAAQALCPNPEWFSDDLRLNVQSKELIEATLGKWIIEASDLAGKRKAEIEQLKALLSRQRDGPARMAYAREPVERARQFILIGTTNSTTYLNDPSGARRFWPVEVQRFDVDMIKTFRDQLWAEACVREAAGESIRLPKELWPAAAAEQERRHERDAWEQDLRTFVDDFEAPGDGLERIPTSLRQGTREAGQVATGEETWFRSFQWEDRLRIVSAELVAQVDARRAEHQRRAEAAKQVHRAPHKAGGKYLLSGGMLICPTCGGHFEMFKAPWKRDGVYICATRRRKPGSCSGTLTLPRPETDEAVLNMVEGEILGTDLIEELLTLVDRQVDTSDRDRAEIERLNREVENLVGSIASGVPPATVAPAIKEREHLIATIETKLRRPRPTVPKLDELRAALEQRTAEWRVTLRAEPQVARLLLRRLIGPLTFAEPTDTSAFDEWVTTLAPGILEGLGAIQVLASPAGFEPALPA